MTIELLLAIITQAATAAGVYAAIRADLAKAIERATALDAARQADERIDHLMREIDDQIRALVPPEGFEAYCETWPDARQVIPAADTEPA